MFALLVFCSAAVQFTCNHNQLIRGFNLTETGTARHGPRLRGARESIRVFFDYTYIDNPELLGSHGYCSRVGDYVMVGSSFTFCQNGDIVTDAKREVVKTTFNNLKAYLEETLKVDRVTYEYNLTSNYRMVSRSTTDGKTDLFITLYPYPFGAGSTTLASALAVATEVGSSRPLQGATNINFARVPAYASDITTPGDRNFFEIALHETCHILGISGHLWEKWRNPEGEGWGDKLPKYNFTKLGKTFNILHTPKLHQLMANRWGIEYFDDNPNYPVGVELEDAGGPGTLGSHWEFRVFFTELMVGATVGYARISDVTLTALEDTGWYDVNYSRAEMHEWGNYKSILGKSRSEFRDFAAGQPVKTWPDHYLIKNVSQIPDPSAQQFSVRGCTFDHRAVGIAAGMKRETCTNNESQCQYPEFYDPNNIGYYGNTYFDYLLMYPPIVSTSTMCFWRDTGNANRHSMCARQRLTNGELSGGCFDMSCEDNTTLFVHFGEESKECSKPGTELSFTGLQATVLCPDPAVVCGILPQSSGGGGDEGTDEKGGRGLSAGAIAGIVIAFLAIVVVVVVVVVILILPILRRKRDGWIAAEDRQ